MKEAQTSSHWILGLGGSSHEFSALLSAGPDIRVAIEEERISRVKYGHARWYEEPASGSVRYCLDSEGIDKADIATVVSSDLLPYRVRELFTEQELVLYPHHLTHAASVYALLPEGKRAAILAFDGMGSVLSGSAQAVPSPQSDRETFSFYIADAQGIQPLGVTYGKGALEHVFFNNSCSNSVGLLYELVTGMLGFGLLESGKTMGLAAWGTPVFLDAFSKYMTIGETMSSVFTFDPFNGITDEITDILERENHSFTVKANLAATVQRIFVDCLFRCYELLADLDVDAFCLAGGCALNTVANGELSAKLPEDRQFVIPPYAGDSGCGLGALWLHLKDQGNNSALSFNGAPLFPAIARPGRKYRTGEIDNAVNCSYPRLAREPALDDLDALARSLADGNVVGFFNGRSEIGPRALGGRSILSDPRSSAARERLNREIKHREPFRPLAPIVLDEYFDEYFTPSATRDYFMLKVAQATPKCQSEAPAVVHIDGSARVQAVSDASDSVLATLLRRFYEITGVPVLLNTSFNGPGEPIVETPDEAAKAFLELGLDVLWLDGRAFFGVGA